MKNKNTQEHRLLGHRYLPLSAQSHLSAAAQWSVSDSTCLWRRDSVYHHRSRPTQFHTWPAVSWAVCPDE